MGSQVMSTNQSGSAISGRRSKLSASRNQTSCRSAALPASTSKSTSIRKRMLPRLLIVFLIGSIAERNANPMRILYCNKYNFPFSGTEVYLFELMDLMRSGGHEVALFSMSDPRGPSTVYDRHFVPYIDFNQSMQGLISNARLAAHAIYSPEARRRFRSMIRGFLADVAYVRHLLS